MTEAETIIATLRAHRAELEAMGVRHAALFGSRARGDGGPDSDIDIALRFAPETMKRGLRYFGQRADVEDRLSRYLSSPVEVSDEAMMRDRVRLGFEKDRIVAF